MRSRDGTTELQHRKVMEEKLGRPLRAYENVHHSNGVRGDNRPENLELWITKQPKGQREADVIQWAIAYLGAHGYKVLPPTASPREAVNGESVCALDLPP